MDAKQIQKLEILLEKWEKQYAVLGETAADIRALLSAAPTSGQQVKTLFDQWASAWRGRYGAVYHFDNREAAASGFRRLLKTLPVDEAALRINRYLRSNEAYYQAARHPLEMFFKVFNKFGEPVDDAAFLTAPAMGCTHRPLCASDQAHTARVQRELRG